MQIISHDFLYLLRAVFFGLAFGFSVFVIIYYFKPLAKNVLGVKEIDTDLWWWSGMVIAVILGIASMLLLL
jgi:hypothetical protein